VRFIHGSKVSHSVLHCGLYCGLEAIQQHLPAFEAIFFGLEFLPEGFPDPGRIGFYPFKAISG
jgi:hypothetical protein